MLARVNSPVQWQPATRPPTFAPITKTHVTDRFGDQQPIDARSGVEAGHARVETSSLTGFRGYSPRLQERLRTSGSVLVCNHVRSIRSRSCGGRAGLNTRSSFSFRRAN